jgi:DNA-binding response OmpR family regulator
VTNKRITKSALDVLVADDEDYIANLLETLLREEGFTVHVSYNGRQSMAIIESQPIDLVISDLMMPYLSGDELIGYLETAKEIHDIPIILMSAVKKPRKLAPNISFIAKPFNIDEMLALVKNKIARPRQSRLPSEISL